MNYSEDYLTIFFIDIDECQIYGKCDQGCVNTAGSYRCTCEAGYILQDDRKTCKADGKLVCIYDW